MYCSCTATIHYRRAAPPSLLIEGSPPGQSQLDQIRFSFVFLIRSLRTIRRTFFFWFFFFFVLALLISIYKNRSKVADARDRQIPSDDHQLYSHFAKLAVSKSK